MTAPLQKPRLLERLVAAIERLAPVPRTPVSWDAAEAFIWQADSGQFVPVREINRVTISLLQGIDDARDKLLENTKRFADGLPANNSLLWGARGTGKSSLVKAVHGAIAEQLVTELKSDTRLKLIEIHREEIASLPHCLQHLRTSPHRFIVFCDDLSFDRDDTSYKSLKAVLEGGIEGRPRNVIFYATSNRRHLMPRDMMENERATAINPSEAVEEMVSLSDRFGLWLGFHAIDQETYLAMVRTYRDHFGLKISDVELERQALEWSLTRGARSGRVAWQFIQDVAGRLGQPLDGEA